jgi:4-amino-4-deoxychorismate lyase
VILVDGTQRESVSARDRGLAYGDGVFRTLLGRDGVLLHWSRHYAKLAADCAALGITCPEEPMLRREANAVAGAAGEHAIKMIVTRGAGERGYSYAPGAVPTRIVLAEPLREGHARGRSGVHVRTCRLRLSRQPALAGIKHLNRLENVLARAEWNDPRIAEGLMMDGGGDLIGGTMTNLFIVTAGRLATPLLTQCGVEGVTRERVIALAAKEGIECREQAIAPADLAGADEVFLVNSLAGLWPVCAWETRRWRAGPLSSFIQQWLDEDDGQVD